MFSFQSEEFDIEVQRIETKVYKEGQEGRKISIK